MKTIAFQTRSERSTLSAYAAPEVLLHEFNVENGFAASEGDLDGTSDSWTKNEEEIL